jgi:uncharacterized protein YndB with AHSA1/START domain
MIADRRKETLTLVREIRATPEQVFRALTEPEELTKWWGAKGALTGAHVNLRPGGEYRFEFTSPRGVTAWVKGQYQAVEPPRRVVMTWFSSKFPDLRNSVEIRLEAAEGGTRLTLVHGGLAGRPEVFEDCKKGWEEVLQYLAGFMG